MARQTFKVGEEVLLLSRWGNTLATVLAINDKTKSKWTNKGTILPVTVQEIVVRVSGGHGYAVENNRALILRGAEMESYLKAKTGAQAARADAQAASAAKRHSFYRELLADITGLELSDAQLRRLSAWVTPVYNWLDFTDPATRAGYEQRMAV